MGIFYPWFVAAYLIICVLPCTIIAISAIRSTPSKDGEFFALSFLGFFLSLAVQTIIAYSPFIFRLSASAGAWQIAVGHFFGLHILVHMGSIFAVHTFVRRSEGAAISAGLGLSAPVWFILGLSGVLPQILGIHLRY